MDDPVVEIYARSLPDELQQILASHIADLREGRFQTLLQSHHARLLLGHEQTETLDSVHRDDFPTWADFISRRLDLILAGGTQSDFSSPESPVFRANSIFAVGYAALLAFLQSNYTGPPLPFSSAELLIAGDPDSIVSTRRGLVDSLCVDGSAAYKLTPSVELLSLANAILSCPTVLAHVPVCRWAKLRSTFIHQRILSEPSSTLEQQIYDDLEHVQDLLSSNSGVHEAVSPASHVHLLLEHASIDTFYGHDRRARASLEKATQKQGFEFALTGALGRRTKFQQHDISQLVVLARSLATVSNMPPMPHLADQKNGHVVGPTNLQLDDDTLLESISFSDQTASSTDVKDVSTLQASLAELDPADQPRLRPLDSIILLALASSITNTSPANGLTREETIPYATRVLEGGSSNWQVYTQALLVRSRIEGYKSRTVERGLLQLQAVVDQVIADTSPSHKGKDLTDSETESHASSFLPRPRESESAPVSERLSFVFQLASPARWNLEAELAQRWVQLGGLRSALDIYERLEMWAEAALCWAATEREERGRSLVRRQLYHATDGGEEGATEEDEKWQGQERSSLPADAARLFCILGDLDQDPGMYERAWQVSGERYARAQRSLGRFYFAAKDYVKAAEGYSKSLKVNQLNHGSWFALGCALLELGQHSKAVEAFTRCVQLDDQDAEAWSNLAAALLKQETGDPSQATPQDAENGVQDSELGMDEGRVVDSQKHKKDALRALKRAASLKHESFRIWENVLIVAASIMPPDYLSIVSAQKQLIHLRGPTIGEKCVDVEIIALVVRHVVMSVDTYDASKPGFERLLVDMVDKEIVPLITSSRPLWQLVARLSIWRNRPATALDAQEKAWRTMTNQPGWDTDNEARWNDVVDATIELCDAYESLGPRETTEGLGAGSGALVAKDWTFKARSALRGILGRGKTTWEDTEGWTRLQDALAALKA